MKTSFVFELYHENSKLREGDIDLYTWINFVNSDFSIRNVISNPILAYGCSTEISLPPVIENKSISLYESLLKRRSQRAFEDTPCPIDLFSSLLTYSIKENAEISYDDGIKWCFRPYPSGGGLYPIDVYIAILNVENIPKGLYFYNSKNHSISELENNDELGSLKKALPTLEQEINKASFFIFLVSDLNKMAFKYQERAYRFALLECGHIAQNLLLSSTSLELNSFPVGAFLDDEINACLNIDGISSNVQYIIAFGT